MILIEPLSHGFSGTRVVKVQPFYTRRGGGRQAVVKFGDLYAIEQKMEEALCYWGAFICQGNPLPITRLILGDGKAG